MPNKFRSFMNKYDSKPLATSTKISGLGAALVFFGVSACTSLSTHEPNQSASHSASNGVTVTTPKPAETSASSDQDTSVRRPSANASSRACNVAPSSADSSVQIQACLDSANDGDTVTLTPGVYGIGKMLHVDHAITLATSQGAGPCRDNANHACAELRAMNTVSKMERGFLKISAAHVTLSRIVVNGNNSARLNSPEAAQCRAGNNGQGINIHVDGTQFSFSQSSSIRALCGSGLEVGGVSEGLRITQSYVSFNGTHNSQNLWSDGITIADSVNAEVGNNEISDNTDVDLIFGGCKACQIHDNQITHSNSFTHSSFAAVMMQAWPNATSGNYNNSAILNNRIDCGRFRCGFGLLIGSNSWYVAPAFGGTYRGNHISGAQSGFVINDATGAVEIGSNIVDQSGGSFLTSGGTMKMAAYALSPKSSQFIVWADDARSHKWQSQEGTGKIANWWTKDSSGSPSDDSNVSTDSVGGIPNCSQLADPASDVQFVLRLYCQILGREPDPSGFQNWLRQVSATSKRTDLVISFFLSPESLAHGQIQLNNAQSFVRGMYQAILARPVDPSGLATWTARFNSGSTPQTVLQLFLQNPEPKQTFGL